MSNLSFKFPKMIEFFKEFLCFSRYLQEIGYTDTIIDVRSNRVRSLLGLNNNTDTDNINTQSLNGNESNKRGKDGGKGKDSDKSVGMMKPYKSSSPRKVRINFLCLKNQ